MANRNYNTQIYPRVKLNGGGRAKKQIGGTMRQDEKAGYFPADMGMAGGAMYRKGGKVKKKGKC